MFNSIQFGGDSIGGHRISIKNVTAVPLVLNGLYQLDLTAADSDTSGATNVVKASLEDVVALTAAGLRNVMVIADKALAAGDQGLAYIFGVCTARVDAASFPIAKGDRLCAVAGSTDLVKFGAGFPSAGTHSCAVALEAATTDNATIKVLFDGLNVRGPRNASADKTTLINRTGGALVAGGLYMIDVFQTATESTTPELGLNHAVAVTTAGLKSGLFVIATATTADDAAGEFYGPVGPVFVASALVEGTTDIAKGDRLTGVNAQAYLKKASVAAGSIDVGLAVALEDFTTDATGLKKVIFNGVAFNNSINGATS